MAINFSIPQDLADKITPKAIDPIEEQKQKKLQEEQQLQSLRSFIEQITNNPKIIEACKDGALLIKEREDGYNLYLGYAVDVSKKASLCFFLSHDHEKNDGKVKSNQVGTYYGTTSIEVYINKFDIFTTDQLNTLVLAALSKKYTGAANKELLENLDKEEK